MCKIKLQLYFKHDLLKHQNSVHLRLPHLLSNNHHQSRYHASRWTSHRLRQPPQLYRRSHGNHQLTQVSIITNPRKLRPIVAKMSIDTSQMGCYLRGIGSIPVVRPQDVEKEQGKGTINVINSGIMEGKDTKFKDFKPGTTLYL